MSVLTATEVIAVIPARHASVRLPGKPLADIGGKPMVQHVWERASESSLVRRVVVATDHEEIARTVRKFGGEAVMTPPELPSGTDRIAHFARSLAGNPVLVNVQGDEPFVTGGMIDAAVRPLLEGGTTAAGAVAVGTVAAPASAADRDDPSVVKVVVSLNSDALYFSRSPIPFDRDAALRGAGAGAGGEAPKTLRHFGIYAYRREVLLEAAGWKPTPLETAEKLEQLRFLEHGRTIRVAVGDFMSVPVDTPEDLAKARKYYKDRFLTQNA